MKNKGEHFSLQNRRDFFGISGERKQARVRREVRLNVKTVLNVMTFGPKCNKVLNVITFGPKCNNI